MLYVSARRAIESRKLYLPTRYNLNSFLSVLRLVQKLKVSKSSHRDVTATGSSPWRTSSSTQASGLNTISQASTSTSTSTTSMTRIELQLEVDAAVVVVLHPRGHWHHSVLCVFGAGVPKILPGFPVLAEGLGHWQCWACAVQVGGS